MTFIATWLAGKLGSAAGKLAEAIILLLLILAIPVGSYLLGSHNRGLADQLQQQQSIAKARDEATQLAQRQQQDSAPVEIRYVDRIQQVSVPVVQIRDRLVRACPGGVQQLAAAATAGGLQSSADSPQQPADAASAADPDDGILGRVADEIPACVKNTEQLKSLQELVRVNGE